MNQIKRVRDGIISFVLLALPFFVLSAHLRDPARINSVDEWILGGTSNFQSVAATAARWTSDVFEDYVYLVEVREENDRLRAQVARLEEERQRLASQGIENRRLRSLLQLRERLGGEVLAAQVIGKDVSPFFRVTRIEIDRGERDHVRPGMPVVAAQGLVGQVRRTFGRYCDVLLVVDRTSAVDVTVQRTGARGMLRGTGESERYMARIQYLGREDAVRVGDLVHTSGLGQRFPASILVGRVTRIVRQEFGLWQEVEVTPAVDFSSLEEVLVLTEGSREQSLAPAQGEDERDARARAAEL
ncbi:rod shape-determining protein MreC [Sandaracinus amylolyticus]|uniref:Cell shape-determining protein MreC n=1 Tax=Sandaracinus amylolyticus TaxID=927083 RepID=A0A0F6SE54_9BACT|nr:rod shape-determining protein MreC [Sandaracinus amylolyticus]AKF04599.1 Rod shape-determining protein MreC [Sandaracinus amylolyticus]